jgi:ribonuclease VapC
MIVDSSALLAVVFKEPGFEILLEKMTGRSPVAVAAPTLAETGVVLGARLGERSKGLLERILDEMDIQEIPFGELHWREAAAAYAEWGKGQGPAGLNFGDCMTYAVARLAGEPLLFVGDDFAQTDIEAA